MNIRLVAAALVVSSVVVAAGPSYSEEQQPTFRASVDLVQVDVVVVDKDGHPVEGLTSADFAILDRRRPQKIATFDEVSHRHPEETPAPAPLPGVRLDVSSNRTGQSERLIVASGGFAVTNTDDFTSGLKRIVEDLDHYYLLGSIRSTRKGRATAPST